MCPLCMSFNSDGRCKGYHHQRVCQGRLDHLCHPCGKVNPVVPLKGRLPLLNQQFLRNGCCLSFGFPFFNFLLPRRAEDAQEHSTTGRLVPFEMAGAGGWLVDFEGFGSPWFAGWVLIPCIYRKDEAEKQMRRNYLADPTIHFIWVLNPKLTEARVRAIQKLEQESHAHDGNSPGGGIPKPCREEKGCLIRCNLR